MRRVRFVGAVHAAGADDADGRLARGHDARLHRRGVRAQNDVVVHIERILRVARGMVLGQVQQLEVVVIVARPRGPSTTSYPMPTKISHHFIQRDIHGMQRARAAGPDRAALRRWPLLRGAPPFPSRVSSAARAYPALPPCAARASLTSWPTLGRSSAGSLPMPRRRPVSSPFFAKNAYANLFKLAARLGFAQLGKYAFADFLQTLLHHDPVLSFNLFLRQRRYAIKRLRPRFKGRSHACSAVPPKFAFIKKTSPSF